MLYATSLLTYVVCSMLYASHRFDIYVGKKQHCVEDDQSLDMKSGPAAVVRNLRALLGENHSDYHLVVTDRFYTSPALALQLLSMKVYILGTCMPNR
jgi:hypothetical protein